MIPALSIRQPWAWLIVNGYKDIENRDWPTHFRGEMLVHASKTLSRRDYNETVDDLFILGLYPPALPAYDDLQRGGLVGWTRVVDCVEQHPSPWKMPGGYGFVLRDSRPIPFLPFKGRLGFLGLRNNVLKE